MKTHFLKMILIISLMISLKSTQAQYQSLFGSTQTSWNIHHEQLFGNLTDSLVVDEDTVVSGSTYKKLLYYTYFGSNPTLQNNTGYLSEDTITGKSWYFSTADTNKRLIMDLSLTLSDSFSVDGSYVQVDSVYYLFGKKHIRFDLLTRPNEKFIMIEGVGTNKGICYNNAGLPQLGAYLLCQHKDSIVNYQNTDPQLNGVCNSVIMGLDDNFLEKENLVLYPNPTSGEFTINLKNASKSGVGFTLTTLEGRVIQQEQKVSSTTVVMDLSEQPKGIYLLKIEDAQSVNVYKVIRQ